MSTNENLDEEIQRLRRLMRDIVAVSSLPAVWTDYRPADIARSLADVLVTMLSLDLLYIRLQGDGREESLEVARSRDRSDTADRLPAIVRALEPYLDPATGDRTPVIDDPVGDGSLRLAVLRFGYTGDVGVLVAGSRRSDFPSESDRLRLGIGVNQGAVTIQRKQLEERLHRAAADLSDANRRKDEFLAILAHELRNPLAPIRTGLEVMKLANELSSPMEKIRITMERQVQQMVRLIDDLLDVSRITQGKLELRKREVRLDGVVRDAVEASRPFIDDARHELEISLPPSPILLRADPHRLAQVLSNLLNNAAKYTPAGGRIWLSGERQEGDVVLSVKDTGIGIPAGDRHRIFEMFAQIDRPLEKGYTGLGIGLTLVKSLVEMHGGRIDVQSDGVDRGSEFILRIPIPADATVDEPEESLEEESRAPEPGQRVLVVDDNEALVDMLTKNVEMLGNEVRSAGDGQEAIEIAEVFRPDLVLMDIGMPKMSGYEVARHIRRQPWSRNTVLVAMTGWGKDEDKRKTREAGFDDHLVKPAEPSQLRPLFMRWKKREQRCRSHGKG